MERQRIHDSEANAEAWKEACGAISTDIGRRHETVLSILADDRASADEAAQV